MLRRLSSVAGRSALKLHRVHTPPCQVHGTHDNLPPLIFIHGLLASESTYRAVQKRDDFAPYREKIGIDLCNHGASPWVKSEDMTYARMSEDVIRLMDDLKLPKAVLLGHSMGGKVAMHTALKHNDRVERLIVVDITPLTYRPNLKDDSDSSFALKVMNAINKEMEAVSSRAHLNDLLEEHGIKSQGVRQFLLTNIRKDEEKKIYQWKTNVEEVAKAMPHLLSFQASGLFDRPTCLIRGGHSRYVPFSAMKETVAMFPSLKLVTVSDAGHWVQAQQPKQFCESVNAFLGD